MALIPEPVLPSVDHYAWCLECDARVQSWAYEYEEWTRGPNVTFSQSHLRLEPCGHHRGAFVVAPWAGKPGLRRRWALWRWRRQHGDLPWWHDSKALAERVMS